MPKTIEEKKQRFNPYRKENDNIPENLFQDAENYIIDAIKAGFKYNKEEESKYIEDLRKQLFNIRNRKTNTEKNNYTAFFASRLFPKEDGEEKYNKKISLYKEWYKDQPEIFITLQKLYKLYFDNSHYDNNKMINDEKTINSKLEALLLKLNNELDD